MDNPRKQKEKFKDNKNITNDSLHKKKYITYVTISAIIFIAAFRININSSLNNTTGLILIILSAIVMIISAFAAIKNFFEYIEIIGNSDGNIKNSSEMSELEKSQKAIYLMLKKKFEELESTLKINSNPISGSSLDNLEKFADKIIEDISEKNKVISKVTISKNKENTDAIISSNDKIYDKLINTTIQNDKNMDLIISKTELALEKKKEYYELKQIQLLDNIEKINDEMRDSFKSIDKTSNEQNTQQKIINEKLELINEMIRNIRSGDISDFKYENNIDKQTISEPVTEEEYIPDVQMTQENIIEGSILDDIFELKDINPDMMYDNEDLEKMLSADDEEIIKAIEPIEYEEELEEPSEIFTDENELIEEPIELLEDTEYISEQKDIIPIQDELISENDHYDYSADDDLINGINEDLMATDELLDGINKSLNSRKDIEDRSDNNNPKEKREDYLDDLLKQTSVDNNSDEEIIGADEAEPLELQEIDSLQDIVLDNLGAQDEQMSDDTVKDIGPLDAMLSDTSNIEPIEVLNNLDDSSSDIEDIEKLLNDITPDIPDEFIDSGADEIESNVVEVQSDLENIQEHNNENEVPEIAPIEISSDPNHTMTPEEIAALIASMN